MSELPQTLSKLPTVLDWLDAVADMLDHQQPLPRHVDASNFGWVRDFVLESTPYLAAVGIKPLDLELWVSDPVKAILEARNAMSALQSMDSIPTGGVGH